MRRTRLTLALALVAGSAVVGIPSAAQAAPAAADVPVQLITMNDFHGRISQTVGGDATLTSPDGTTQTVGGSANIASTVTATRQAFVDGGGSADASYFVGAGDLVSASSFESAFYRDEPTVEVLNAMGLSVSSVGNHEFDRGTDELARISGATDNRYGDTYGACDGRLITPGLDGCFEDSTGADFHGTDYPYLAANVLQAGTDEPFLPPYEILDVGGGKKVALIGVVTETTPTIVAPTGIEDVDFIDEADAINRWVPVLQGMGIQAIGVLIHEGGVNTGADAGDPNGCAQITGPIADINNRTDAAVDFIVSAHTHQNYSCYLTDPAGQPRLVTQAGYYGRLVGDVRLVLDGETGDVDRLCGTYQAANVAVTRSNPDPEVAAIVGYWNARSAVDGAEVVGATSVPLGRARTSSGGEDRGAESQLGNTVAEAQLQALAADPATYGDPGAGYAGGDPVLAFMNPGGLRADIDQGPITFREVFDVQPFGNYVSAVTLTGEQIRLVLEQQYPTDARARQLVMGTSEGFTYDVDPSRPAYDRVDPASIRIDGVQVQPAQTYRVVANSFLVAGGDSFTSFLQGTSPLTGPVDVETFQDFLVANDPGTTVTVGHGTAVAGGAWAAAPLSPPAGGGSSGDNGADTVAAGVRADRGVAAAGFTCPAQPTGPGTSTPVDPGTQPITNPGNGIAAGHLANTGAATGQLTALGVGLLLAGGIATAAGYRRGRGVTE